MLMQPRPHFPHTFDTAEIPDSSPASTFFDPSSYPPSSDPTATNFVQNSYGFGNPFASSSLYYYPQSSPMNADGYQAAAQSVGRDTQSQDWQTYSDATQQAARVSQGSQHARKLFRPNDRSFSNDIKKSPSNYSQHLPTPTHTPTQPPFLDSTYLTSNKSAMSAAMGLNAALEQQFEDLPAYAHSTGQSVSSYGHDSPATPRTMNGEEQDHPHVPKFERTISDIYADELFNAGSYTSYPASKYMPTTSSLLSPYNRNSMNERLQAASQAHQTRSVSPLDATQRRPSPFRQGSPFAAPVDFGSNSQGHIGTAAGVRQQQKRDADEIAYQQHHPQPNNCEPATISPKDAVLDYHQSVDDMDAPLYPAPASESMQQSYAPMNNMQSAQYGAPSGNFSFVPPGLPVGSSGEIPLYLTSQFRPNSSGNSMSDAQADFPAHLISMETSASASDTGADNMESSQGSDRQVLKPNKASANRGAYACTSPGCTQRFEAAGKLQKHKREAHGSTLAQQTQAHAQAQQQQQRQASSPRSSEGSSEDAEADGRIGSGMTSAALMQRNAQAGPHRCSRVNPSTGQPCNTVFSRPYDLTRHEDTIHNGRSKKVRCHLCTEEKTFSRSDALTRHMRVVHPEVDFPGKHRRRHVA